MSWISERVLIVGAAGTGKTYTAKAVVAAILNGRERAGVDSRLVIFDPVGDWWPVDAVRVTSRIEFLRALARGRFPIVVQATFEDWSPLDVMQNLVVVGDEMHNFATAHVIHQSQRRLACESRHRHSDLVWITQRARHLNQVCLANATKALILPLQAGSDRRAVAEGLGVELPAAGAWRPVPGCANPRARLPLAWPDDFDPSTQPPPLERGQPEMRSLPCPT